MLFSNKNGINGLYEQMIQNGEVLQVPQYTESVA